MYSDEEKNYFIDAAHAVLDGQSLRTVLNSVPGGSVSVGVKNEKRFTIRGFSQRYVPVFFGGIPIYVPFDGYVDTGTSRRPKSVRVVSGFFPDRFVTSQPSLSCC